MSRKPILLFYGAEQNKQELSCLLFSPVIIHHDRSPTTKTVAYVNKQKNIYIYTHTHIRDSSSFSLSVHLYY